MNRLGVMLAVALLSGCALAPRDVREDGPLVLGDTAPVVTERGAKSIGQIDGRIRFHFGGPVAGRGATNGQALVWDGTQLRWEPGTVSAPAEADTLASVLARGNTSGAVDLIVNASQGLVVGGATTSGVRLEFDSADGGTLAIREGDDSAFTQLKASDGYFVFPNGSELKVRIGAGSYQVGLASDVQVAWYPTANASGTQDLSLERGGVGILKVADGTGNLRDLQTRTETIGAATTAGARLEVNGGVLTVREGDDTADAPLGALTLASSIATGTAPLTVASTTVVTNLNADLIDGLSSASFLTTPLGAQLSWNTGLGAITQLLGPTDQSLAIAAPSLRAITITGGGATTSAAGNVTVASGGGGSSGNSGTLTLLGGPGGNTTGDGGPVNVTGGQSAANAGETGALVTIAGGAAAGTDNNGGGVVINGANGGSDASPRTGGSVTVTAGNGGSGAAGTGGSFTVTAGNGGASGTAGTLTFTSGAGGTTSGASGPIALTTGTPVDGNGGTVTITTADGVGTNRSGGQIVLDPGVNTGSGEIGYTRIRDHTAVAEVVGGVVTITDNTATAFVTIGLVDNSAVAGTVQYSITVTDGTDYQSESGTVAFAVVDKADTLSSNLSAVGVSAAIQSAVSTLVTTFSVLDGTNTFSLRVTSNSSLVPTVMTIRFTVTMGLDRNGTVTVP